MTRGTTQAGAQRSDVSLLSEDTYFEYEIDSTHGKHDDQVTHDTKWAKALVDQKKPFVDQSVGREMETHRG